MLPQHRRALRAASIEEIPRVMHRRSAILVVTMHGQSGAGLLGTDMLDTRLSPVIVMPR